MVDDKFHIEYNKLDHIWSIRLQSRSGNENKLNNEYHNKTLFIEAIIGW